MLPTPGNAAAAEAFGKNIFSVTRQVRYSADEAQRALDMVVLINGVQFRSPEELTYTTKQAIQECFILDVIANYTPVSSFYQVAKTIEDDPEVDKVKALKK